MSGAYVFIDRSQFPEKVRHELLASLRARAINHKFHYQSYKQAAKWLALHEAYSPARKDSDGQRIYDAAFRSAARIISAKRLVVVGLGCGGGQKEARLIQLLGRRCVNYVPSDVSLPLVLNARTAAERLLAEKCIRPVVCDLATAEDFESIVTRRAGVRRVFTFFGMIPNFEPVTILPPLAELLRAGDLLLFSANLAPGTDYEAGVRRILPQYDNELTRDWLLTLLFDLGVEPRDGELRFSVEQTEEIIPLLRIVARFHFVRRRSFCVEGETFQFQRGDSLRLFFSYRHTPEKIEMLLQKHGIKVLESHVTRSGEEGVFVCAKI